MEVQELADHGLDTVNAWVAEFHHFMTFGADDVVVLTVAVALLVLGEVAAELVLAHEALLNQQVEGVVDGGAAYLKAALLHTGVEFVHIEVTGAASAAAAPIPVRKKEMNISDPVPVSISRPGATKVSVQSR